MKEIKITQNRVTLVDDEDFEYLNQFKWWAKDFISTFYAGRKQNSRITVLMHRVIMNCPQDKYVDHIDGDGLNNQKSNLRVCSNSENGRNRGKQSNNKSGYIINLGTRELVFITVVINLGHKYRPRANLFIWGYLKIQKMPLEPMTKRQWNYMENSLY